MYAVYEYAQAQLKKERNPGKGRGNIETNGARSMERGGVVIIAQKKRNRSEIEQKG